MLIGGVRSLLSQDEGLQTGFCFPAKRETVQPHLPLLCGKPNVMHCDVLVAAM